MSTCSENEISSLLELIPPSQHEPHQIATTEEGDALPTYRLLRAPQTLSDLKPFGNGIVVSMENGTLVTLCNWSYGMSPTTKFTKYLKLSFCATTAVFFGTLRSPERSAPKRLLIEFKDDLNFDAARSEKLALLFEPSSTMKILFLLSKVNKFLSAVLATRPYPINLEFEASSMDCDVFIEHLEGRKTSFGSLSLGYNCRKEQLQRRLFNHLNLFDHLQIDDLPCDLILTLLAAPIQSIGFTVCEETGQMNLAKAMIVPKAIKIEAMREAYPTTFLRSFLSHVAQLRHLESLSITLCETEIDPADIGKELTRAIRANRNLKNLVFHAHQYQWGGYIQKLFLLFEKEQGLQTLQIQSYPDHLDPKFKWLKRLLTRNRYLEVSDILGGYIEFDDETFYLYEQNRFFRGSKSLKEAPAAIRPLLVGTALTYEDTCDFQYAGMLLTDHVDVFCELLEEVAPTGEADVASAQANVEDGNRASAVAPVASAESSTGQKRKRKTV